MPRPNFSRERRALSEGLIVCGIDEAGRGPLAGPVVAAAVILVDGCIPKGLNDSKQLTEEKREQLFAEIMLQAEVGIGVVEAEEIDRINILQATFAAMKLAVSQLPRAPQLALVDGNRAPPISCTVETIVKGDGKCTSIAAASIVAKVTRDRLMSELCLQYPQYGFSKHKGYGTAEHLAAISAHGPCPLHRRSFAPLKPVRPQQLGLNL